MFSQANEIAFGAFFVLTAVLIFFLLKNVERRKESEARLRHAEQKLQLLRRKLEKESSERSNFFETLLRSIPIPIFYKDKNGIYLGTNEDFDAIYGFERNFLVGKSVYDVAPKEIAEYHQKQEKELFEHPTLPQVYEGIIVNNKTGKEHNVVFHKRCYLSTDGEVEGLIGAIMDITEIKAKEKALEEAKEKAESAMQAKSQFLAVMSHEIRTPLNAVLGMLHLVLQTDLDAKQKEYIQKSKKSAQNLLQIINDILDFSKMEAGKIALDIKSFDLHALVEEITASMEVLAVKKGIELHVKMQEDLPCYCMGDSFRIAQVVLNLLSNAIKFTEKGSVKLHVSCLNKERLQFVVEDTGIGMDQDVLQNIFEAFNQADGSVTRKFGGTGLGLSISKQLVELMGGAIEVSSKKNEGSRFLFWIPTRVASQPTQDVGEDSLETIYTEYGERETDFLEKKDEQVPKLTQKTKEELFKKLHECAKKRRSKLCKSIMQEVGSYELSQEDKALFDTIYKLILQRKYAQLKEMTSAK